VPFRVLDAPQLKDDYYCSILAYCYTSHTLAVALTNKVYLWTEEYGVRCPPLPPTKPANFVTSLAFSSDGGAKSILAVARHKGNVTLWSLLETRPRFEAPHPCPASCVAFRPRVTHRPAADGRLVECEDLIVGDDNGRIYYYSVDWPDTGAGSMSLLVKLNAHAQNICGFAWAPDGQKFVSGGNDNVALLFTVDTILGQADQNGSVRDRNIAGSQGHDISNGKLTTGIATPPASPQRAYIRGAHPNLEQLAQPDNIPYGPTLPPSPAQSPQRTRQTSQHRKQHYQIEEVSTLRNALANPTIPGVPNLQMFALYHAAAVKAVAFAPWQANLLATGGGSNDRQIHFYHTGSGAALAVINVFAQVTSLVWSTTRRELAVTFGYAQPDHEIRIAVFSWPDCKCVVSIPWERKANGEIGRALWAIPYPGGPNDAVPTRKQSGDGFSAWENARLAEARRRRAAAEAAEAEVRDDSDEARGRSMSRGSLGGRNRSRSTPAARRRRQRERQLASSRANSTVRGEGETWASRTEEEGSLIIACCDQTVKFFEVWAGKSKGSGGGKGLGTRPGVLGGSRILEGWCEGIGELGRAYRRGKWSEEDEGIR
jgi:WD40 repeat protein